MIVIIVYTGKIRRTNTMKYTREEARIKATQYTYEIRHGRHTEQNEKVSFEEWFLNGIRKFEEKGAEFELLSGMVKIQWPGKPAILRTIEDFHREYDSLFPSATKIQFEEAVGIA
jgi:hypothetical protein